MHKSVWLTIWPGLAAAWLRGSWTGLAIASAFAAALNFALVSTFVWPQVISQEIAPWVVPATAWVLVLWFWIVAARSSVRILAEERARQSAPDEPVTELLSEAQTHYLKGHYSQAESILQRLLAKCPGDGEALLLLATLSRRCGRNDDAARHLRELEQLPRAAIWRTEIQNEKDLAARANTEIVNPAATEVHAAEHASMLSKAA